MKPTIDFHNIVSLQLTPIITHHYPPEEDRPSFTHRRLIVEDADGDTFSIGLYGDVEAALANKGS